MDFIRYYVAGIGRDRFECRPDFEICDSKDVMIKNHTFYAFWNEKTQEWDTKISNFIKAVDRELKEFYEQTKAQGLYSGSLSVAYMRSGRSKSIDEWNHFVDKQMYDNHVDLDSTIVFLDDPHDRELYSSHRLSYSMADMETPYYDKMFHTLYDPEELEKIEWAIGSIIHGDSKWIQKFFVLTGAPGTGKSTLLWLLTEKLFEGYAGKVDADKIGSGKEFAFETISSNPLVGFQDEVDLSKLQTNTGLNALVSHEFVTVNEKNKKQYSQRFQTMIFLCSNNEVNITDSKAGIIRRLIDVHPSGRTLSIKEYRECKKQIVYELGGIAKHCLDVYLADPGKYDNYIPVRMMRATNIVYSWLEEAYYNNEPFIVENGVTVTRAYNIYKKYCDDGDIKWRLDRIQLRNELTGYFDELIEDGYLDDGTRVRNYFHGFKEEKFARVEKSKNEAENESWLEFKPQRSILDSFLAECKAQYANEDGKPLTNWEACETVLRELDTSRLHYVLPQGVLGNLVVLDFDKKNEAGGKDYLLNKEMAERYPPTYAELSKSGAGIHLHYIFAGNVNMLQNIVEPDVEIKIFPLDNLSSLRRQLTECNNLPIATISSGLPLRKEERRVMDRMTFENEQHLISIILKQLRKETHSNTHQSVSMIKKALDDAYASGMKYYIPEDIRLAVMDFALRSTNNRDDCCRMVDHMIWESDDDLEYDVVDDSEFPLATFDIEVFPNKLFICYGEIDKEVVGIKNPTPEEVAEIARNYRLIGFNNRKYDNHICHARELGQSIKGCYLQSHQIVDNSIPDSEKKCFLRPAYGWAYADAYDIATKKQSLKKWEIELHQPHKELEWDWDTPLPDEYDDIVMEYCKNDVRATAAVWKHIQADVDGRMILSEWSGLPVSTPTNTHTSHIIFDGEKNTQPFLKWRDLSKPVPEWENDAVRKFLQEDCGRFTERFDTQSVLPYFPGYKFECGKSTYKGFEVGEGGFVYSEPGMHTNVALLDVESMHPNSFIDEVYAGVKYTRRFKNILDLRIMVKHKDFERAAKFFDGIFAKHLQDKSSAKALAFALKIAINSVYGLTAAKFQNAFYNPLNKDNIVAKRGALFMIDLLEYVEEQGYTVAHIKTDSIKIPNADPAIIQKVIDFGHRYGYNFNHEATYEKMCLVNDAVYIAKYQTADWCMNNYNYIPDDNIDHGGQWTATGEQFKVPYVFKTLFSHEPIVFDDVCETKSVTTSIYIDMAPETEEHDYRFVGKVGQFTPVKFGGGILLRKQGDKLNAVGGSKGYKWVESDDIRNKDDPQAIDMSVVDTDYYMAKVNDAYKDISKYGDVEWFLS